MKNKNCSRRAFLVKGAKVVGAATLLTAGVPLSTKAGSYTISNECIECHNCYSECPVNAIIPGSPYTIDSSLCNDCGSCVDACPTMAIEIPTPPAASKAVIDYEMCTDCGSCIDVCNFIIPGLFSHAAIIKSNNCTGCGDCVDECPVEAISLV